MELFIVKGSKKRGRNKNEKRLKEVTNRP